MKEFRNRKSFEDYLRSKHKPAAFIESVILPEAVAYNEGGKRFTFEKGETVYSVVTNFGKA